MGKVLRILLCFANKVIDVFDDEKRLIGHNDLEVAGEKIF